MIMTNMNNCERNGAMFKIRAKNSENEMEIYNEIKEPAVICDRELGVLITIGEKEQIEKYYEDIQIQYRNNHLDAVADDIVMLELPKDQAEIDKVFQISGYIKKYLKEM